MSGNNIYDPILFRQQIKQEYSELVWKSYLYQDTIEKLIAKKFFGSLNSVVQLFLQYVVKEWACPNCLQTILPFMDNCLEKLPKKGDIIYVYSQKYISKFPVLFCPHCECQIVVIAINEYSDVFEFKYKLINETFYNLAENRRLTQSEIEEAGLIRR
ncbi:MAG: hypothetical protein ACXAC8_06225 [Candidatus Hodarchaeales archaeon]